MHSGVGKGGESMQTPVRFYITQNDDQPIVRTIPVTTHPVPKVTQPVQAQTAANAEPVQTQRRVAKLVRSAVRRTGAAK
jgi:hypothetical protein